MDHIPWPQFWDSLNWKQGEHVALIGPTGQGKTTLGLALLERRDYVAVLSTKPTGGDETLTDFARSNDYDIVQQFPDYFDPSAKQKLIIWPTYKTPSDEKRQRAVIGNAMYRAFSQQNWCVYADEVFYISKMLGLTKLTEILWSQGRSAGISFVAGTQRPAYVPLMIYNQSTHLFFFRDNDEVNLKRIGGIGWLNARYIKETVAALPKYHALYINSRSGAMVTTKLDIE